MNNSSPKLSLIIPCFNEVDNLPELMKRLDEVVKSELGIEFVLVNNGSTDHSDKIFIELTKHRDTAVFKYLKLDKNRGYGGGILAGLEAANGDVLGWTHADIQTDPRDIVKALKIFRESLVGNFIVKGKRIERDFVDQFFTQAMHTYSNLLLSTSLTDINGQPKLFTRNFYSHFIKNKAPRDFSIDLFLLYAADKNGFKVLDFPVQFSKRILGVAKGGGSIYGKFKLIMRTLRFINNLRMKAAAKVQAPESHH